MNETKKITKAMIRVSYFKAFGRAIAIVFFGIGLAFLLNSHYPCSEKIIRGIGVIGGMFDTIAIYGYVNIITWCGSTPEEKLDKRIANICVFLGLLCLTLNSLLESKEFMSINTMSHLSRSLIDNSSHNAGNPMYTKQDRL